MSIPTEHDRQLGEINDLAALVMIRLRTFQRAGVQRGDPLGVQEALERYSEAVKSLAGFE